MAQLTSAGTTLMLESFVTLERTVWDALVSGDSAADAYMLEDDFLGVYSTGFEDKQGHVAQLQNGPTVQSYTLLEPRYIELTEGVVLLAYKVEFRRCGANASDELEVMYISSIWRLSENRWRNIFSQDTAQQHTSQIADPLATRSVV